MLAMPPKARSARVTTGLKWAPDTGARARISATSAPEVAAAFSSNSSPRLPGDNRAAAMPEPTTAATSRPVPRSSARSRRPKGSAPTKSGRGFRAGVAARARAAAARVGRLRLGRGHLGVGQDGVDLPGLRVGAVDPHLVLHRVATGDLVLHGRGQAARSQPG